MKTANFSILNTSIQNKQVLAKKKKKIGVAWLCWLRLASYTKFQSAGAVEYTDCTSAEG